MSTISKKNTCASCANFNICLRSRLSEFSSRLLERGERLCYQGQHSKNLYIIRSGLLKSTITKSTGEEYVMGFYFPPDLFGWEGIDAMHRSIEITALDQSNICIIPTENMFALTRQIPQLGTQLLNMVSRRIHQDNVALLRTTTQQRVATFLLQLSDRYHQLGFARDRYPLIMAHQDIANYLRITSSTISRTFHEFTERKLIQLEKHMVRLLEMATMQGMAEM